MLGRRYYHLQEGYFQGYTDLEENDVESGHVKEKIVYLFSGSTAYVNDKHHMYIVL